MIETGPCTCIKTPGGLRGFGAWCKEHSRLLSDYEFQKAKADQVVAMYDQLKHENAELRRLLASALDENDNEKGISHEPTRWHFQARAILRC